MPDPKRRRVTKATSLARRDEVIRAMLQCLTSTKRFGAKAVLSERASSGELLYPHLLEGQASRAVGNALVRCPTETRPRTLR